MYIQMPQPKRPPFWRICLSAITALVIVLGMLSFTPPQAMQAAAPGDLLQFQSGGHVVGFATGKMYVSNGTYALRVEFVDADNVVPQAGDSAPGTGGAAPPLAHVTYPNLWPDISLTYDAVGGIARSTYTLTPGADPADIRLRYNAPVVVEADGSLRIAYATGIMRESAPVAWQEIDGARVPVAVDFVVRSSFLRKDGKVSFRLGAYDPRYPLTIDPTLTWNTFLGGSGFDFGYGIAVDGNSNVYVTGYSNLSWGVSPVRAFTGANDAFAAKLDHDGNLTWNTFLGGNGDDRGYGIAVDGSGNVYVTGYVTATWGVSPVRAYTTGEDAFVAELDADGGLTWHTFLGGSGADQGFGISVDSGGNVYVTGHSATAWTETPLRGHSGNLDAFVADLDGDGNMTWHTFLGGSGLDTGRSITLGDSGFIYVAGYSFEGWSCSPTPCTGRAYTALSDAFAARLNSSGTLTGNTFLGGDGYDYGYGVVVDGDGNIYVAGRSGADWGNPGTYTGGDDAFVAKLGANGSLTWNTFLGGSGTDYGSGITLDDSANVYVVGRSDTSWGNPVQGHTAGDDAFVAQLDNDGGLTWNTFLGGSGTDQGNSIALDSSSNVYIAGNSNSTWGSPVRSHSAGVNFDAFAAQVSGVTQEVTGLGFITFEPLDVTINVVDRGPGDCLTEIEVAQFDWDHPDATESHLQTGRYWSITQLGCTAGQVFTVTLIVPLGTVGSDPLDKLCRWTGTGWDCGAQSDHTVLTNYIRRANIHELSTWTVGDKVGPNAVTLHGLLARGGPWGIAVLGFVLAAGLVVVWRRKARN